MKFEYTSQQVEEISQYLQKHMKNNKILSMTADECADLLDKVGLLQKSRQNRGLILGKCYVKVVME